MQNILDYAELAQDWARTTKQWSNSQPENENLEIYRGNMQEISAQFQADADALSELVEIIEELHLALCMCDNKHCVDCPMVGEDVECRHYEYCSKLGLHERHKR